MTVRRVGLLFRIVALCTATPLAAQQITVSELLSRVEAPLTIVAEYGQVVTITGRTFQCGNPDETAIRVIYPDAASVALNTVILRDNEVLPGCRRGLWVTNGWNARVEQMTIWGAPAAPMEYGVLLDGRSNDVVLEGLHTFYTVTAVAAVGQVESPKVKDSALIQTEYGVVIATEEVVPERPGAHVTDTHIAASKRGIVTRWHPQASFRGNLIYRIGTEPSWVGIEVGPRSADTLLTGNVIMCGYATGTKAVTLSSQAPRSTQSQTGMVGCASGVSVVASGIGATR